MQIRQHALCMSHIAVSLLSSRASQDIHKLNKVEEGMNNLSVLFSAPILCEIFIATSAPAVQL